MKTLSVAIVACALIMACDQGTSPGVTILTASFTLADTAGKGISTIRSGEDFVMSFSLINTTLDTLTYGWGYGGPVGFRILQNDSAIATSVDGYVFPEVFLHGYLAPGDTMRAQWKAPNTPVRISKVVLAPGTYQAWVGFPNFHEAKVNPIPPITFIVVL